MKILTFIFAIIVSLNANSQIYTSIDSLGFKFKIQLPSGSEYQFLENSMNDEAKEPIFETNLQFIIKIEEHYIYLNTKNTYEFEIEIAKKGWLIDSTTKIIDETNHSLIIYTNDNNNEEYQILYHKTLGERAYTFSIFYQSLNLSEVKLITEMLDNIQE